MKTRLCPRAGVLLILILVGCNEDSPDPTGTERVHTPRSSLQTGTATIVAPNMSNHGLPTYPYYTLVRIDVAGVVEVQPDGWASHETDARGRQWGWSTCVEGMSIFYEGGWSQWKPGGGCQPNQGYVAEGGFTEYLLMGGAAWARWDGEIPNSESTYDGGFSVTVTPVQADLNLIPSRYVVLADGEVVFTALINPSAVAGINVPYSDVSWDWTPDTTGGSDPASQCGIVLVCTTNIPVSGTMEVTVTVNGETKSRSVHIRVICASTGDPRLDSLPLLDAMATAMGLTGDIDQPGNQTSRREVFWRTNCTPEEGCVTQYDTTGTPCTNMPDLLPDSTTVADGHTHPYHPVVHAPGGGWTFQDVGRDSTPDVCHPGESGTHGSGPMPSPEDLEHVGDNNPPGSPCIPHYILDGDAIIAIPCGAMTPAQRSDSTRTIPRDDNNCQLVLRGAKHEPISVLATLANPRGPHASCRVPTTLGAGTGRILPHLAGERRRLSGHSEEALQPGWRRFRSMESNRLPVRDRIRNHFGDQYGNL